MRNSILLVLLAAMPVFAKHTGREIPQACDVELDFVEKAQAIKPALSCVIFNPSRRDWCLEDAVEIFRASRGLAPLGKCLVLPYSPLLNTPDARFTVIDSFALFGGRK